MSHWDITIGQSDEWYTPKFVFDALGCSFDLDPAHPPPADLATSVPAARKFSDGGLEREWSGFVWMNPPFGGRDSLWPWLRKFFAHGNGVALTPDRTSTLWFWDAWSKADLVLFTRKIKFLRPDGSVGARPSNGTALWAAGEGGVKALQRAHRAGLGILAKPCGAAVNQGDTLL